jgi:hypothetical protein
MRIAGEIPGEKSLATFSLAVYVGVRIRVPDPNQLDAALICGRVRRAPAADAGVAQILVNFRGLRANTCVQRHIYSRREGVRTRQCFRGPRSGRGCRGGGFAVRSFAIGKPKGARIGLVAQDARCCGAPDSFSRSIVVSVAALALPFCFPPVNPPESCP